MKLRRPAFRNLLRPLLNRSSLKAQETGRCRLGFKVLNDIGFAHGGGSYPMRSVRVNDGIQALARSSVRMETMGDRIKQLLLAQGISQAELGRRVGVTRAAVQKWISGDTANMENAALLLTARELHTDAAYLVWGADRKPPGAPPAPQSDTDSTGRFRVGGKRR